MKKKPGRPKKLDKKVQVNVKLPPYLIAWLNDQKQSRAVIIENLICEKYGLKKPV